MINMARIQGPSIGFQNYDRPILRTSEHRMGQDGSFSAGPIGAGVTPGPGFNGPADLQFPGFPSPIYPPNYAFAVNEPIPATTPTPAPSIPTWAIVGGALAAGAAVAVLLMKK